MLKLLMNKIRQQLGWNRKKTTLSLIFTSSTILMLSFQNCGTRYDGFAEGRGTERLTAETNRLAELEVIFKDLLDKEKNERLASDAQIEQKMSELRLYVETEIANLKNSITFVESELKTVKVDLVKTGQKLDQKVRDLEVADEANADQLEIRVSELQNQLAALKLELSQSYATKEELAVVRSMYNDLKTITSSLDLKITISKEEIEKRLDQELVVINSKLNTLNMTQMKQAQDIQALQAHLEMAIAQYKTDVQDLSEKFKTEMQVNSAEILSLSREDDKKMRAEMMEHMANQGLAFTLYVKAAISEISSQVKIIESRIAAQEAAGQSSAELKQQLQALRESMADAIAQEQAARKEMSQQIEQLAGRVSRLEKDLIVVFEITAAQAKKMAQLGSDFEAEKVKVETRFKVERETTTQQLANLEANLKLQIQNVAQQAAELATNLGQNTQMQLQKLATDLALLNSRVATVDSRLKAHVEEVQTNRARMIDFELKLATPRDAAERSIVNMMRTLADINVAFVQIVAPDEKRLEAYDATLKPLMAKCGGVTNRSFPNVMGLDSFQILSMEYARMLLLGERSGNANIDAMFHDFGAAAEDGFTRDFIVGLTRFPVGAEDPKCLDLVRTWARSTLLKSADFNAIRNKVASSDKLARLIEQLYSSATSLKVPADTIQQLLVESMTGLPNYAQYLSLVKSRFIEEIIQSTYARLAAYDSNSDLQQYFLTIKELSGNNAQLIAKMNQLKLDLDGFKATTNTRLQNLETQVGSLNTATKRTLDVLMSLVDRAGHPDLRSEVLAIGAGINYTPRVIPEWNARVTMIQHFFSGELSRKNATDACTGAKVLTQGGIKTYYQNGSWGDCWVNWRSFPNKEWANEAKTLWFRVFGSAHVINVKVDASAQKENQNMFANYGYDMNFDFTTVEGKKMLQGDYSNGVFDIRVTNLLDVYIQKIRLWSGMVVTITPKKIGANKQLVSGTPMNYSIQLFSPIILDFNRRGVPQTLESSAGVLFDMDGDGQLDRTGWVRGTEAGLLALDLNRDGVINDGKELFGDATRINGRQFKNGYAALAQYDDNKDGVISAKDPIFDDLVVWFDENANGVSEAGELKTLAEAKVKNISVQYVEKGLFENGNELRYESRFQGPTVCPEAGCKSYDAYFGKTMTESQK